jgi:hypothetical protein
MSSDPEIEEIRHLLAALPNAQDVHLLVLKGHLIAEQLLLGYINACSPNPTPILTDERMSFAVRSRIAESLREPSEFATLHLWEPLRRLGKLRNSLAHQLKPTSLEKQVDGLIQLYEASKGWRPREYRQGSPTVKLRYAIVGIHQFLAASIATAKDLGLRKKSR